MPPTSWLTCLRPSGPLSWAGTAIAKVGTSRPKIPLSLSTGRGRAAELVLALGRTSRSSLSLHAHNFFLTRSSGVANQSRRCQPHSVTADHQPEDAILGVSIHSSERDGFADERVSKGRKALSVVPVCLTASVAEFSSSLAIAFLCSDSKAFSLVSVNDFDPESIRLTVTGRVPQRERVKMG